MFTIVSQWTPQQWAKPQLVRWRQVPELVVYFRYLPIAVIFGNSHLSFRYPISVHKNKENLRMKLSRFPAVLFSAVAVLLMWALPATAESCFTSDDMDAATRTALQNTATRYFDMVGRGDFASLKQNAIPAVANNFAGIEATIRERQSEFTGAHATVQPPYLLKAEGTAPLERADFLCGVFNGPQAAKSAEFIIPNLPGGTYGVTLLDFQTPKGTYTLTLVLQQQGTDWKLGGFFLHPNQILGHDADWFLQKARDFKAKGQNHNAFLYFFQARDLAMPLSFMYSLATDKIYDELQSVRPSDFPVDGTSVQIPGPDGKTYRLTALFPLQVEQNMDIVVKYLSSDISNSGQTFQENMNVMRAVLTKFPELREAFDGVVTRAVEMSGKDYGSMLAMKDIK